MNERARSATRGYGLFAAVESNGGMATPLTRVLPLQIEQRINTLPRLSRPARRRRVDLCQSVAYVPPEAIFCRVRSDLKDGGRALTQLRALQDGRRLDAMGGILGVALGAQRPLQADGKRRLQWLLEPMPDIEALGINLIAVPPAYRRTLGNRVVTVVPRPASTIERHAAPLGAGRAQ
jgi:hypothetical protein